MLKTTVAFHGIHPKVWCLDYWCVPLHISATKMSFCHFKQDSLNCLLLAMNSNLFLSSNSYFVQVSLPCLAALERHEKDIFLTGQSVNICCVCPFSCKGDGDEDIYNLKNILKNLWIGMQEKLKPIFFTFCICSCF